MSTKRIVKNNLLSDRWNVGNKFFDLIKGEYFSQGTDLNIQIAKVIESGEEIKKTFMKELGYVPPDGTIRARVMKRHSLYKDKDCPLFFPLMPNTVAGVAPAPDSYVLTTMQDIFGIGDKMGNGFWIREITRATIEELTGESFSSFNEYFGDIEERERQFYNDYFDKVFHDFAGQ